MKPLFPHRERLDARWIWGPHDPAGKDIMRLFRVDVGIREPRGCCLKIAADSRYRLWINGQWIGRGSAQSPPWLTYQDSWDLSEALRAGGNAIAIAVYHLGIVLQARPGLLAELRDSLGRILIGTGGEGWLTRPDPAWLGGGIEFSMNRRGRFQERVDAQREVIGWQSGPAGSGWSIAEPITHGAPWSLIVPRHAPLPVETPLPPPRLAAAEECQALDRLHPTDFSVRMSQVGRPVQRSRVTGAERLATGGETVLACAYPVDRDDVAGIHDPCLLFDAGRVVTAFVEIDCTAPAGAELTLGYAERLVDGRFTNALECPFASGWTCRAGRQTVQFADWRAFRWLRIRLGACPSPLTIHGLRLVGIAQDLGNGAPFACGDEALERIRAISLASVRLCCVDGIYDTPHREGAQWLGDVALVTVPILQQVFDDTARTGQFLRQSHAARMPTGFLSNLSNTGTQDVGTVHDIPDYSLWWVRAVRDQWRFTGDRRWVDHCWPGLMGLLAAHQALIGDDGLAHDVPGWVFIDWAPVGRGRLCAAYNAILALALESWRELCDVRGDARARQDCDAMLSGIQAGFARAFWDEQQGCVLDGLGSSSISEHANAAAILAGLLDESQVDRAIATIFEKRTVRAVEAEPFFMAVVLPALRASGRTELALDILRQRYGRMLRQGVTSALEEWGENGSWRYGAFSGFQRTHSHAWSGCPATFLAEALAGIEPLVAGGAKVRVAPWPAPFPFRIGRYVGAGLITVAWDGRTATVESPAGVSVDMVQPSITASGGAG